MEGGVVDRRRGEINGIGYVNNNNKVIKKKNNKDSESSSSNKKNRKMKKELPRMVLQQLYLACKSVFKGPGFVPPPPDIQKLCRILNGMKPEDVGISSSLRFFKPGILGGEKARVTCTTIYCCKDFSLVLFFLPEASVIPFHNHPDMTVFSKLLVGTLHIKSYDWVESTDTDNNKQSSSNTRLAQLKTNGNFTAPCNTEVLYPTTGGNIHRFTAITPCIVLDVLGPPYSKTDGRDCSYYRESPFDAAAASSGADADADAIAGKVKVEDGGSYAWLEEIEAPEESVMDGIQYLGPQIVEM